MRRAGDQDTATGVISLGLLANGLELLLSTGKGEPLPFKVDISILEQWENILQETINFIQTPETGLVSKQGKMPRFLSRARYLEQIYTATPENNRKTFKALANYLQEIHDAIAELSNKKQLNREKEKTLSAFAESVANEAIKEASKFHQEPHIRKTLSVETDIKSYAEIK